MDTANPVRAVESIVTGLQWRRVSATGLRDRGAGAVRPRSLLGAWGPARGRDRGLTVAAGLPGPLGRRRLRGVGRDETRDAKTTVELR